MLAAGLLGAMTNLALAQSNVTIYGIVDLGINYTDNVRGNTLTQLQSGNASGSRIGFKGSENLGSGLSAVFQLENGFNADNGRMGQGGRLFGRMAFVGLSSASAGRLTLGRQADALGDYPGGLTANNSWGGTLFTHPFDNDTSGSFTLENSLNYTSPTMNGLTFSSAIGLGEQAGSFSQNSTYSFGMRYNNGPLTLAAGFINLNHPGMKGGVPSQIDTGSISNADVNFVSDHQQTIGLGAGYVVGAAAINMIYFHTKIKNPVGLQSFPGQSENVDPYLQRLSGIEFNNFEINSMYKLSPSFSLGTMYTYTQGSAQMAEGGRRVKPVWHMLGAMLDYNLSKRTDIYTQVAYQRRAGQRTGTDLDSAHIAGTANISSSNQQGVVRVGLRHRF
ncbi:porin [Glaciimonas immobilis]|uniref:Putative porin n=2 Tax=Glaciimonas immobilis TaxID=728004 RepID=A0A840RQK7_9BURK|nr:porin [Glaciimonas immobilis]KAF3999295.1 porin [Glaciimonas immobilis]MBB5198769.1 putative porin [Glaciimonas immobilis]